MSSEVIGRLKNECETMRSRVQAILKCENAISSLMEHDVFGHRYRALLEIDCRQLTEAIQMAKDVLRDSRQ